MTSNTCNAITRSGRRCSAPPLHGCEFCFHHDPQSAEARRRARATGGHRSRRMLPAAVRLETEEDIRGALEFFLAQVIALGNTASRNRAGGYLISIAVRLRETIIEERLAALERAAGLRPEQLAS